MLEFDQDIFLTVYLNFKYFKNYNASIFIQVTEIKRYCIPGMTCSAVTLVFKHHIFSVSNEF